MSSNLKGMKTCLPLNRLCVVGDGDAYMYTCAYVGVGESEG